MGERVLIHAAGSGVGTAAIQLAHAAGAASTALTHACQLEKAMSLGLDVGLSEQDFAAQIKDLTHGAGVHMILDFVGAAYIEQNIAAPGPLGSSGLSGYHEWCSGQCAPGPGHGEALAASWLYPSYAHA